MKRRRTRQIKVGGVRIGGGSAVSIQSMAKVETSDVRAVVSQIKRLEECGCEIIRVAVKSVSDADAIRTIKKKIKIPLVADIHFDYRLALESIRSGADKIRLNPGNLKNRGEIEQVVRAAKKAGIPIRIGINSGSIFTNDERRLSAEAKKAKAEATNDERTGIFVKSAMRYVTHFEELGFHDIIISLKGSDVAETVDAYRKIAGLRDYPLHLGVTASGPYDTGIVKSSIGIGALLLDGIGDTIRVSLTAEPEEEVAAAKRILGSLGLRKFGPEIISCPICGRCQVDLNGMVRKLERKLYAKRYTLNANRPISIALMGCEVNGPGEAREADIGIAFGKNSGMLFRKGKIIRKIAAKDAVKELMKRLLRP